VHDATKGGSPPVLDTLAAAYAEAGRFEDATSTLDRAIELARRAEVLELVEKLTRRRVLYASGQAYRDR